MELLFESRRGVYHLDSRAYFFQREPELLPEPVLLPDPDRPYEGHRVYVYGSVLHDGGRETLRRARLPLKALLLPDDRMV